MRLSTDAIGPPRVDGSCLRLTCCSARLGDCSTKQAHVCLDGIEADEAEQLLNNREIQHADLNSVG